MKTDVALTFANAGTEQDRLLVVCVTLTLLPPHRDMHLERAHLIWRFNLDQAVGTCAVRFTRTTEADPKPQHVRRDIMLAKVGAAPALPFFWRLNLHHIRCSCGQTVSKTTANAGSRELDPVTSNGERLLASLCPVTGACVVQLLLSQCVGF